MKKISEGDIISIKGISYEVLRVIDEIDGFDVENNKKVGEHLEIALHKTGDKSMHPTNYLYIYKDDSKILFSDSGGDNKIKVLDKEIKIKAK